MNEALYNALPDPGSRGAKLKLVAPTDPDKQNKLCSLGDKTGCLLALKSCSHEFQEH
jgi:hypothetical protein